ncbi:hypothetical protein KR032_001062, partial [Drosophila birchii]
CSLVAICCLSGVVLAASSCNTCQDNNVKCVNETHFSLCSSGVPPDQVIGCPDGQVCTGYQSICMPLGATASCTEVNCPACDGSSLFVCTSRTTFQTCNGNELGDQIIKCKDNTFCSINSGKYCVDRCEALSLQSTFECDRDATSEG